MEEQDRSRGEERGRGHLVQLRPGDRGRGHDQAVQQGLPRHPGEPGAGTGLPDGREDQHRGRRGAAAGGRLPVRRPERRTVSWRGLAEDFTPPTALDPGVRWRWPVMNAETKLAGVFASVSGLNINTKLVPPEKYPKSYWDLVRDPYWVDLIKRKRVAFTDPRIANIGVYHMYGLKEVNGKEYGEAFIREFAGLKPKLLGFNESGEVARGELHAMLGGPWRVEYGMGTVAITKLCLEPGCVSTQSPLFAVVKNAPHPNAAKVFVDFVLSREYAEWRVQALGNTPARADVAPRPLDDPAKHKLQYAGDDKAERQITEVLKWVIASKLFDY